MIYFDIQFGLKQVTSLASENIRYVTKVHTLWEGHKNLKKTRPMHGLFSSSLVPTNLGELKVRDVIMGKI